MNMTIDFSGFEIVAGKMDMRRSQVKAAAVKALNATGYDVIDALKEEMRFAFDRPTPYTLNSLRLSPKAAPSSMIAKIAPAEWAGKGTLAKNYLGPEIFGGERKQKRSERALESNGVLPRGMFTVPGNGAKLDSYGNMDLGQLRQILSYFGSAEARRGYTANMTDKTKARLLKGSKRTGFGYSYFAIRKPRGLRPGIYKKMNFGFGRSVPVPMLMFVNKPTYRKRYRWHEVASKIAKEMFERNLAAAMISNDRASLGSSSG